LPYDGKPGFIGMASQSGSFVTQMFDYCWALGSLPAPKGRGLVIQTHSGGPGANAADAAGRAGLKLPNLSEATREKLKPFFPNTASINNPVDMTFSRNISDLFSIIPQTLMEDENADALLMYFMA
jgi:acetate---CoA ligase (ADP-forming) subunit alpha